MKVLSTLENGGIEGKLDEINQTLGGLVAPSANRVEYNNVASGLTAINVQGAIDEVDAKVDNNATQIDNFIPHLSDVVTDADGVHGLKIEEGTWTPVFKGTTVIGNNVYGYQRGKYIKTGKLITIFGSIAINTKDANMSGEIYIDGLPFTCNSVHGAGVAFMRCIKIDMPTSFPVLNGNIIANANKIHFFATGDNQPSSNGLDVTMVQNGTILEFSATYMTN